MNTELLVRLRRNFKSPYAPPSTQRHNIRAWVKSRRMLGDKYILSRANANTKTTGN